MQTKEVIPLRIVGVFRVVSKPLKDSKRIFKLYRSETIFPYIVKLKPLKVSKKPLLFKELKNGISEVFNLGRLNFQTNY